MPRKLKGSIKAAWKDLSLTVRLEAADDYGRCQCVTCGEWHHWTEVDAGHWQRGRRHSILLDERHVFPQCRKCNRYSHRNPWAVASKVEEVSRAFDKHMLSVRGRKVMEEIKRNVHVQSDWTEDRLSEFREELKRRQLLAREAKGL